MKNYQIVKLINKYEKKSEKISPDLMDNLLSANSELIDYILNSDISTRKLERCFKYSLFSTLNLKTQIFILENDNGEFGNLNVFFVKNPKFILKILKIIYGLKNSVSTFYGISYLREIEYFGSVEFLIFKIIVNAKSHINSLESFNAAKSSSIIRFCKPQERLKIIKIIASVNNPHEALNISQDERVIKSGFALELAKIVGNSKCPEEALYVAANNKLIKSGKVVELTKIVAFAQNPEEASIVATNTNVIKSGYVLELTSLVANINETASKYLCKMIVSGYIDIVIALIDVFKKRVNVNNFDAVISLITSGDYERSKNPIESLGKILRTTNNYQPFTVVYKDSVQDAVKGAAALDKAFPGIDIKGNTYIKTRKNKKENKHDNNE